jgi:hypothetical protein
MAREMLAQVLFRLERGILGSSSVLNASTMAHVWRGWRGVTRKQAAAAAARGGAERGSTGGAGAGIWALKHRLELERRKPGSTRTHWAR